MIQKLKDQINAVFVGKEEVVDNVLICLLAGGHVLLEDVPGVGKTTLARTLASATRCTFGRIQFTPDTLPTDVTGMTVYNMKSTQFDYREGPVMHQILLADEINRTSPKTQASLLEAMAEGQVTVDGTKHALPDPFLVIATQNPIEFVGTYPLPEAQLDRFMMRLSIGYPEKEQEILMARHFLEGTTPETAKPVCSATDILHMRELVEKIHVSEGILSYIREVINATRHEPKLELGASPRALLSLLRAAQAHAYLDNKEFVRPDDVKAVAVNVLHHRLSLTAEARMAGEDTDVVLRTLISQVKIPKE